jgi:glycosyltransferase involved in cell wall biosynthesis
VVLFYQNNRYADRLRDAGIEVLVWEAERKREVAPRRLPRPLAMPLRAAAAVRRRRRLIRDRDIQLIHLNNAPLIGADDWLPAGAMAGVPVISHARGLPGAVFGAVRARLLRRYAAVVAISRHIERGLLEQGLGRDQVVQIYDGIDLADLRARAEHPASAAVRAQLGVHSHEQLVLMVGHLWTWKGQDVLLEAVRRLPDAVRADVRVALAGGTAPSAARFRTRLDELAASEQLAGRVSFLGPRDDAAALMHAADVVVHASRKPEPFGLVVVEAMALGRPVIASRLGGPGEIVEPGSGLTFDPDQPDALAAALERVLTDPIARGELSHGARSRACAFDIGPNVKAIEALYERVLQKRVAR